MGAEVIVTAESFRKEVLESEIPVLVDFWAEWCGPCVKVGPIVSEIAENYEGRLKVCKVNVDKEASIAADYGITSIPTLIVFKGGEKVKQHIGAGSMETIEAVFKEFL